MSGNFSNISQRFSEPIDHSEIAVALCNALSPHDNHRGCSFSAHRWCALSNFNRGTIDSQSGSDIFEYSPWNAKTSKSNSFGRTPIRASFSPLEQSSRVLMVESPLRISDQAPRRSNDNYFLFYERIKIHRVPPRATAWRIKSKK